MSEDDTGDLANEQIERERSKIFGKGGEGDLTQKIGNGRDPRFTALMGWCWVTIGGLAVGGILWVASSISELNKSVTTLVVQNQSMLERANRSDIRDDRQDIDIRDNQRSIAVLEGKSLRGEPLDGN